jgi:tetratricopeptide (TPR) repeat protein
MRKILVLAGLTFAFAGVARAQLTKNIVVQAGTPEDKATREINATTDPAQKLALIDKFNSELGKGDMSLLANELYMSYYLDAKNWDKLAEYAQKQLAADPDNFFAEMQLVRANAEKHDAAKEFEAGEKCGAIVARYRAAQAPADVDAASWKMRHEQYLADEHDDLQYVQASMLDVVYHTQAPADRAALAERFVAAFPDSPYTSSTANLAAMTYQGMQAYPKMIAVAQKALAIDANNGPILVLLADYYSEKGEQLDQANTYAKKAIEVLPKSPKPDGIADSDWSKQVTLQTGVAWSAQGQILVNKKDNAGAVTAFQTASPMLKAEKTAYARNLYRLGYTYALLKKNAEAKAALTEAASLDTPYKPLAQDTLSKLGTATPPQKRPAH